MNFLAVEKVGQQKTNQLYNMCGTDNLLLKWVKKDLCAFNEASKNGSIDEVYNTVFQSL